MATVWLTSRTGVGGAPSHSITLCNERTYESADRSSRHAGRRPPRAGTHSARPALRARCEIESPYGLAEVADSVGLAQLAKILAAAPREIASVDLTGQEDMRPPADLGPLLDATAKRAYRRRLNELQSEIDDADGCADIERAGRARLESTP